MSEFELQTARLLERTLQLRMQGIVDSSLDAKLDRAFFLANQEAENKKPNVKDLLFR
jgi:hypothetical protein